jgi:cytochrome b subunit of formate dehydrogenase
LPQSFQQYALSVHGQGAARGVAVAASCADCHSVHDLKGAADPESRINPINVASTCGQCHPDVQLQYDGSIHGRALQAGITDSPTCTDCHGEHLILSPEDPEAATCGARQAIETCGGCHNDPLLISKYGLQEGVVGSYLDSYHGWASKRGCDIAASCVDCHSAHMVLPEEDPASTVAAGNVVSTCRQCHERADTAFAASYNHVTASMAGNPVNRIIRDIYLWAIALIIGGMILHNLVILNYFMIKRRKDQEGTGATVLRFTMNEVFQHLTLTVGFVVLVITGFALRFPEAWWVEGLAVLGMTEPLRGDIHRGASILLILTCLYHAWYILATRRGRKELLAFAPRWRDWKDLWNNLRFHTFRSVKRVPFGRYDYMQKAEYWALVWGTIVMVFTGLVLWFPTIAARFLPGIFIPASQTVHYYEAWLATLAILVWHFFFVILHPEEYPMSWTWLTGRMTKEAAKEHHGEWFEEEFGSDGEGKDSDQDTDRIGAGISE